MKAKTGVVDGGSVAPGVFGHRDDGSPRVRGVAQKLVALDGQPDSQAHQQQAEDDEHPADALPRARAVAAV